MGAYFREILLIFVLIILNAFFSASEIAIVTVRTSRIASKAESGDKRAKRVLKLKDDPNRLLATIQIGITLAGFLASATAAISISKGVAGALSKLPYPFLRHAAPGLSVLLVTLAISYLTLVLGELVPKRLALGKAEEISLWVAGPISFVGRMGSPFVSVLTWSSEVLFKAMGAKNPTGESDLSEEELRLLVTETRSLHKDEKDMIENVLGFRATRAHELMVPRTDIIGLPESSTIQDAIGLFTGTGLSRIPVYEGTLDKIIGILTVKDILPCCRESDVPTHNLREMARPAYQVPETKLVTELLRELKNLNVHMAILVDEYGGTAGLVTLEDLIEEIVGEIRDEFDPASDEHFHPIDEKTVVVDGIYSLEELNNKLPMKLPECGDYETVGGFMLTMLGKIPKAGDEVRKKDWLLTIQEMDGPRISKVRIVRD